MNSSLADHYDYELDSTFLVFQAYLYIVKDESPLLTAVMVQLTARWQGTR
jgi:hypothetical protein